MAVGEGFEPPELSFNGFQDRRLQPLGHPTAIVLSWDVVKIRLDLSLDFFIATRQVFATSPGVGMSMILWIKGKTRMELT